MKRIIELSANETTEEELHRHGLTLEHAYQAFEEHPAFLPQKPTDEVLPDGLPRRRPEPIQVIGPDRPGRLLTIIIEPPVDRASHVTSPAGTRTKPSATAIRRPNEEHEHERPALD